jgi:hypothetical protein
VKLCPFVHNLVVVTKLIEHCARRSWESPPVALVPCYCGHEGCDRVECSTCGCGDCKRPGRCVGRCAECGEPSRLSSGFQDSFVTFDCFCTLTCAETFYRTSDDTVVDVRDLTAEQLNDLLKPAGLQLAGVGPREPS